MPGQHSSGYQAAYARAARTAVRRYRTEHPDEWRRIVDDELRRRDVQQEDWYERATKDGF